MVIRMFKLSKILGE
jgi:serine/threonine-protein phosphatase 4 regulatory subunit 1